MFGRTSILYSIHAITVLLTAYFANRAGIDSWYFVILMGLPLLLSTFPKFNRLSYTVNVRLLFPISVGVFCSVLFHYFPQLVDGDTNSVLSMYGLTSEASGVDQARFLVNPIFKDSVSVLYAICVAFLLWKGLTDFDELKHVLYEEANEIRSITDYCSYFIINGRPDENRKIVLRIRTKLLSYIDNFLQDNRIISNAQNEFVLESCFLDVAELVQGDLNDQIALEEIMKALNRVSILRTKRTVCVEKRMSPFIIGLMLLMSVTMVGSFFGNATGEFGIDYVYVFLLPAFYTSIFMTLLDLNSPFDGYWSIKLDAVIGVQEKLRKQIDP